ncbi:MAG: hypothetical protein JWQ54_3010 [Mucilaginibacter sp.]|nr:hypothetical protein [Mucilaginibacter sp.]
MCDSPLERGGGVCPLRHAFTSLDGGEHTPAITQPNAPPLKRGIKIIFRTLVVLSPTTDDVCVLQNAA